MRHDNTSLSDHIIKINPKYAVSYWKYRYAEPYRRNALSERKKGDRFTLSKQAKKSMNNCFAWLQIISEPKLVFSVREKKEFWFNLSFIDLTLPSVQVHSDEYIKKHMLSPFLKWLERSWSVHSYIWKAETQNNGNIHFHLTTDKFIHWKSIRAKWNRLCSAHGYCKVYQDGSNDKGDSATKIKAVINPNKISMYVASYCTKKDTFKSTKHYKPYKNEMYISESCEVNNHYYMKEIYRQVQCSDGTIREYKRKINGRIWNASYNLNVESAWLSHEHEPYKEMINLLNDSSIVTTLEHDFAKVHLFNEPIYRHLPKDVQRVFIEARDILRKNNEPQYVIFTESLFE